MVSQWCDRIVWQAGHEGVVSGRVPGVTSAHGRTNITFAPMATNAAVALLTISFRAVATIAITLIGIDRAVIRIIQLRLPIA